VQSRRGFWLKIEELFRAWKLILSGRRPSLSIEITRECPLRCPGCYAYNENHLGPSASLRQLSDFKGDELVRRVLQVVDEFQPLHLSIVGGDPLVRYRELEQLLPELMKRGIHVQLVTSAFRVLPVEWKKFKKLSLVISVDGLQPEHDLRRKPATYERILKTIEGHRGTISIHCTITAQMVRRPGYLAEFLDFWAQRPETKRVWFSMYTPQKGEIANEILSREQRAEAVKMLLALRKKKNKLDMRPEAIEAFLTPPQSPEKCAFARTTHTVSADLKTRVTPCQFGGNPDCSQCGCIASVALHALTEFRTPVGLKVGTILNASLRIGELVQLKGENPPPSAPTAAEA
jgi:MoaA/NifB/PqqE/SkfB family radical SAM enzyme